MDVRNKRRGCRWNQGDQHPRRKRVERMEIGCIKSFVCMLSRFSRQEYCSGLPFPPLEYLPDPGIEPVSPLSPAQQANFFFFFTTEPLGKPHIKSIFIS